VERQYNEDVEERKERKERKEEEEGGAVPAPAPVPKIGVDDPEALRARIGAQAAQMWIDGFAAQAKTPVHAEQILRWAQHKKEIRKPVVGWSEFSALVKSFNQVTISKATAVVDYSVSNGYAGLFWDRDDPGAAKKEDPTGHIAVIIDPKKYEKYDKLKELPAAQRYSWDAIIAIDNESVAGG
jgi:hypothetical protein